MSIQSRLLYEITCDCHGCKRRFVSKSDFPEKYLNYVRPPLTPGLFDELRAEKWAASADGSFFCPDHRRAPIIQFPPDSVYIEDMHFTKEVFRALTSLGIRTVRSLMFIGPDNLFDYYGGGSKMNFPLGVKAEFIKRMEECGFTITENAFIPVKPNQPYWTRFPAPTIDENKKLTDEEFDTLSWEEKIVAWYLTDRGGHLFFSWRESRPDNWLDNFHSTLSSISNRTVEFLKIGSAERLNGAKLNQRVGLSTASQKVQLALVKWGYV